MNSPAATDEEEPTPDETPDETGEESTEEELDSGELSAEDELDLERLDAALYTVDDESLRRGLAGITEKQRQELAVQLNLPRATMHLGDALVPLVRRKLRGLPVDRQLMVATAITNQTNDATVRALGDDRSDDPSVDDLLEVFPAVIDEYGIELTRLMVAGYAVSDAPCRAAMRQILDTDERFVMPEVPDAGDEVATELPSFGLVATVPRKKGDEDPERVKLREQRKAQKAERRAAASHERAARAAAQAARREALHASKRSTPQ